MVITEVAEAEDSCRVSPLRSFKINELSDCACAHGIERRSIGSKDPEIVHQLDQRNERDQRHQVRHHDVATFAASRGRTIDLGGFDLIRGKGLQASVEDHEGKGRRACQTP